MFLTNIVCFADVQTAPILKEGKRSEIKTKRIVDVRTEGPV